MLRLSRFSYVAAENTAHAMALLQQHGPDAVLMAGGTDVLVNIKQRLVTPKYVVAIRHLPELSTLRLEENQWLRVGAGVTLFQLEQDPAVVALFPALAHACHLVSAPQIRRVGTIGGNVCLDVRCNYYNQSFEWRKAIGFCMKKDSPICRVAPGGERCWAVASADTVPVLIALRAEVSVTREGSVRRVPLEALYVDDGLTPLTLRFGEIVTSIHIPPSGTYACVYEKFRIRQSFDFPLVAAACAVRRSRDGIIDDARVVLTAVASYPQRANAAEQALLGRHLDRESIDEAGSAVFRMAKPMDNTAGTIFHRKRMARILVERGLRRIAGLPETNPAQV